MLSLREQGLSVEAISQQYGVPPSTFYSWLARYETHQTYENRSFAPLKTHGKVTLEIKPDVLKKHRESPRLGCWRLCVFPYEGETLSHTTIWEILTEATSPKLPPQILFGKLGTVRGRPLPDHFDLSLLATGKRFGRTVDCHG